MEHLANSHVTYVPRRLEILSRKSNSASSASDHTKHKSLPAKLISCLKSQEAYCMRYGYQQLPHLMILHSSLDKYLDELKASRQPHAYDDHT